MIPKLGYNLLHIAILTGNPAVVEVLLKEYDANPNIVASENRTALLLSTMKPRNNLSMMKLLTKYGFDFAKLVNQEDVRLGMTVFHYLCTKNCVDNPIACIKYLLDVCEKTPNCSVNILAKDGPNMCGLHYAILASDVDLVRYLLENVYFPNNDKMNKNGITFLKIKPFGKIPLAQLTAPKTHFKNTTKSQCEIFKLLVSYGMGVNLKGTPLLKIAIVNQQTEIVQYMLKQNMCPINALADIVRLLFMHRGVNPNVEILQALYDYGLQHNLICERKHHFTIITKSATVNLPTFKAMLSMVLSHHGINNLNQYNQSDITHASALQCIAKKANTKQDVKKFIEALINHNEQQLSKLDKTTPLQVALPCNNHDVKNTDGNKISNYGQMCSVCQDNSDGTQVLNGFQCDECKSFICNDCVIVQSINKKLDMIGDENISERFSNGEEYEMSILNEILQYTTNSKLFNKVRCSCQGGQNCRLFFQSVLLLSLL